jgi:DNA-binding IclR family transcriptional regulator
MIQSIERALLILEIIAREGGAAKLKHISKKAKLTKSTTHNVLKTFASLGYVKRGICGRNIIIWRLGSMHLP